MKSGKYILLLLILILALPLFAEIREDPLLISAKTDSTEIFIGDQFNYSLTLEWEKGYEIVQVEPPLEMGKFEILEVQPSSGEMKKGERYTKTYSYTLSTYDTGDYEIPPFTITYRDPSGEIIKAESQPIKITVKPILHTAEDTHDIRDIKDPLDIAPKPYLRNFLIGLALVLIVLGAVIFLIIRHTLSRRKEQPKIWAPPRPIEELAMEDLVALENSSLLEKGKIKKYYTRASEILRIYIGRRYSINAIDLTSYELMRALENRDLKKEIMACLEDFLDICDFVKFAKFRPPENEHKATLEKARFIIRETTPQPMPQKEANSVKSPGDTSNSEEHEEAVTTMQTGKGSSNP